MVHIPQKQRELQYANKNILHNKLFMCTVAFICAPLGRMQKDGVGCSH